MRKMDIPYGTESIREFIEERKMAIMEKIEEEKKVYANPVLFLRKSKKGEHLYAFNVESKAKEGGMVLGGGVKSLILNVSDIVKLLGGEVDKIKVSITSAEEGIDTGGDF